MLAPIVSELFAAAQVEAIAFRHDFIGTEHVLLALLARDDQVGRALRKLGLDLAGVREDVRGIVGQGPPPDTVQLPWLCVQPWSPAPKCSVTGKRASG